MIVHQGFHIAMLGDQLKDVLLCQFAESGTEEDIMADVIDSGNQILKGNKRRIAQQRKLAGTIGKGSALKKRKRHAGPKFTGGLWILYQNRPAKPMLYAILKTLVTCHPQHLGMVERRFSYQISGCRKVDLVFLLTSRF